MRTLIITLMLILAGCTVPADNTINQEIQVQDNMVEQQLEESIATFAGGCFWCMEPPFEKLEGVSAVISGYAGGEEANPTYKEVSSGTTGHRESVQVYYDPAKISYEELLDVYWKQTDPTDAGGSFVDRGFQYTNAIFYHNDEQKALAEESKLAVEDKFGTVATKIIPFTTFYPAEDYHQDFYKKSAVRYKFYRSGSGRDDFINANWDDSSLFEESNEEVKYMKPSDEELKEMLTPLQYKVTQQDGTEKPFDNEYWDNKQEGIYVDILSGEPLFSSIDKYKSGTGWPSFTKPLVEENIITREDKKLFSTRTEVRSRDGDNHLGHVFNDGPEPTGLRYCMNSASLRFVPKEDLEKEGYSQFLELFE